MSRAVVLLILFLAAVPASANYDWTAVGSSASIDESSLTLYATNLASLGFQPGATGTLVARLNVTNAYGGWVSDTPDWNRMEISYFDNSPSSSVVVSLRQVSRCTGAVTTICTITSVDAAANSCLACSFADTTVRFDQFYYFVDIQVTRSANTADPQLIGVRIFRP